MLLTLSLCLLGTVIIEYGVLLLLLERRKKVLWASVVMNVLTNVPLNLWLMSIDGGWDAVAVGELVVLVVETLGYLLVTRRWPMAFVYSLLCNAFSFLTGLLIQFAFF